MKTTGTIKFSNLYSNENNLQQCYWFKYIVKYNLSFSLWLFSSIFRLVSFTNHTFWTNFVLRVLPRIFECSLSVLRIFEYSLNSFFKCSWSNFGRTLILGELIRNELRSVSIYGGLIKKSPLETSTLEDTWLILIGQKSKSPTKTH